MRQITGSFVTRALGLTCIFGTLNACERPQQQVSSAQSAPSTPPPATQADHHALHNVHALNASIISGAVPEGPAAFDELKSMGIRTIISVDGATPDVAAAEARGMRYVHIPITYAEVSADQQKDIARAIRDLPGPVYVHCHHGKHRSPAATASVGVALGIITPDEGIAFMKTAGTAPSYEGLYQCVAEATVLDAAVLDSASAEFPSVHKAHGITGAMVEVDEAFEHLGYIKDAGWTVPADHPDLVPAAEAGRLADNLRLSHEDPAARALGEDFLAKLDQSTALASALEEAIVRGAGKADLDALHKDINASCKSCHVVYRDKKKPASPAITSQAP